jgi:isochorismate synthase
MLEALRAGLSRARQLGRNVVVSRSEPLGELPDPFELFHAAEERGERRFLMSGGMASQTLCGVGLAAELCFDAPQAGARLAESFFHELDLGGDRGELGPLLLGGLAFAPQPEHARDPSWRPFGNARFGLPEFLLAQRGSRCELTWSARIAPEDHEAALLHRLVSRRERLLEKPSAPDRVRASLALPPGDELLRRYASVAAKIVEAIRARAAEKVVLAEVERIPVSGALPTVPVLRVLSQAHPSCATYALGIGERTFLGATPECLVALREGKVRAAAVAGTSSRSSDPLASALRHSRKERAEHDFVVRGIEAALREFCGAIDVPEEPSGLGAGRALHLSTELSGELEAPTHVLDLVAALHPTPAVGGTPRDRALELIRKHESFDRGWYAGSIGWVDSAGEGEFHVALRCGLLTPGEVRLYAGAGLVEASDPVREADEVQLKLLALRDALVRACAS